MDFSTEEIIDLIVDGFKYRIQKLKDESLKQKLYGLLKESASEMRKRLI